MQRLSVIDAPRQSFSAVLNGKRVTIGLAFNVTAGRWMMDLAVNGVEVLRGRRIVTDTDLLFPFDLGIGAIFAADYEGGGAAPDYDALVSGRVRLYQATYEEALA